MSTKLIGSETDRSQGSFEVSTTSYDGADKNVLDVISGTTESVLYKIKDEVNNVTTYYGECKSLGTSAPTTPDETASIWRIWRVVKSGDITRTEWAMNTDNKVAFDRVWNDRLTYFGSIPFGNSFSILFDGIDDSLQFGDVFLYDRSNQWSWSLWVKPDNMAARHTIYSKTTNDANVYGWVWYIESTGRIFTQVRTASTLRSFTFSTVLVAGVWTHVTMTYGGGSNLNSMRMYINGVTDAVPTSQSLSGTLLLNQTSMLSRRNTAFSYPGNIDEFTVWNKQLNGAEVAELYNSGSPDDPANHSALANLQNYYKMGDGDTFPTITDNQNNDDGTMTNMTAGDIVADTP